MSRGELESEELFEEAMEKVERGDDDAEEDGELIFMVASTRKHAERAVRAGRAEAAVGWWPCGGAGATSINAW